MLKQAYPAIKSARPDVNVIMGALAYDNWGGPNRPGFNGGQCGPFNFSFLDDVLANGGGDYFDVFPVGSSMALCVGDVVGKGITAALLMSNLQATVKAFSSPDQEPSALCGRINSVLGGNMGRGKGKGPIQRMVIRTVQDRVMFEDTEPSVLVDIDVRLKL